MLPLDIQHQGSGGLDFSLESHCTNFYRKSSKTRLTDGAPCFSNRVWQGKALAHLGDRRNEGMSKCTHIISFFSSAQLGHQLYLLNLCSWGLLLELRQVLLFYHRGVLWSSSCVCVSRWLHWSAAIWNRLQGPKKCVNNHFTACIWSWPVYAPVTVQHSVATAFQ